MTPNQISQKADRLTHSSGTSADFQELARLLTAVCNSISSLQTEVANLRALIEGQAAPDGAASPLERLSKIENDIEILFERVGEG
jgi:hypothetical protein